MTLVLVSLTDKVSPPKRNGTYRKLSTPVPRSNKEV